MGEERREEGWRLVWDATIRGTQVEPPTWDTYSPARCFGSGSDGSSVVAPRAALEADAPMCGTDRKLRGLWLRSLVPPLPEQQTEQENSNQGDVKGHRT